MALLSSVGLGDGFESGVALLGGCAVVGIATVAGTGDADADAAVDELVGSSGRAGGGGVSKKTGLH